MWKSLLDLSIIYFYVSLLYAFLNSKFLLDEYAFLYVSNNSTFICILL